MKVALIADLHLGVKKSDKIFQESQLRFFKNQFVAELKEKRIDTIIVCGDIYDTRQAINVQTENAVIDLFKNVLGDFRIHIVVGNHDIYHTTTTEINSLKPLDLLPNCTVYESPTNVKIGGTDVLMLPWITKYADFDQILLDTYKYAFAHLDIVGFDMGGGLSTEGLTISQVISKIDNTYTGHYHSRSIKKFGNGDKTITYIGSPYQITRIDRGQDRGYAVLDLDTNEFEWFTNHESMIFTKYIYPNVDETKIKGNQVDIEIPYSLQNETKKIFDFIQRINSLGPAYPVNTYNGENPESEKELSIDVASLNLTALFKSYIDEITCNTIDKNELYNELLNLYDTYKGVTQ